MDRRLVRSRQKLQIIDVAPWAPGERVKVRRVERNHFCGWESREHGFQRRIAALDGESQVELAARKVRSGAESYAQVTLRDTAFSPHRVYPAIVKQSDLPGARLRRNMRVGVTLEARGLRRAEWFVVEMVLLPDSA